LPRLTKSKKYSGQLRNKKDDDPSILLGELTTLILRQVGFVAWI